MKFRNARKVSGKTTNQRLTQKLNLNANNAVEITKNSIVSSAGPTDAADISHVIQYSGLPMMSANSPITSVVTSGNQWRH